MKILKKLLKNKVKNDIMIVELNSVINKIKLYKLLIELSKRLKKLNINPLANCVVSPKTSLTTSANFVYEIHKII